MNVNKDFNYAFTLSRQYMQILGIWPDPNVPSNVFRTKMDVILPTCILSLYIIIPQIINIFCSWGNVSQIVELFVAANFSLMALCKIIITRYHGNKLRKLLASIMTDWMTSKSDWERNTMLKLAESGRSLSFGYYIFAIGTLLFGISLRTAFFLKNIHQPRRYLIYRFDYIQKSPNYEISWFLQLFGGTYATISNYSIDSFISILLLHMCGQLINLQSALNNLIEKLDNKPISSSKFKKGIAAIIERHEHLIRCTKTINNCYSSVLFVHLLSASFQICLLTFQIFTMLTDNLNVPVIRILFFTFYSFLVLMQLYIYCYTAERLLMESTNMVYRVYECKWYNISVKDAKDLMIIVYRSRIPLKLSAGKFGNFSLELFAIAIKTSMGYLSALLTIRE
ncbi:odorant receptor 4-like [Anoplolepis gracilipes]|uniref:odorant receptor 4-like n=1 Tax=Anoplolepis gracilipes TaxID=354296 RepID=UPI003BA3B0EE